MSLTLKRLEAGGYVSRERDPADRRVTNVRLTDAGERVRDARTILDPERVARMLDALDPAARAEALRGLVVLAKAADALVWRGRESVAGQTSGER
jgi:DNA-binding MarR family transcriptional regulator